MKVLSIIALATVAQSRDTNLGENCDKDATKTCATNTCCTVNAKRGSAVTALTALCLPDTAGSGISTTYTDTATTPVVVGGATNDVYTYSCPLGTGAQALFASAMTAIISSALILS